MKSWPGLRGTLERVLMVFSQRLSVDECCVRKQQVAIAIISSPLLLRSPHTCSSVLLPSQTVPSFPPQKCFSLTCVWLPPFLLCPAPIFPSSLRARDSLPISSHSPLGLQAAATPAALGPLPSSGYGRPTPQCLSVPFLLLKTPSATTTLALTSLPS